MRLQLSLLSHFLCHLKLSQPSFDSQDMHGSSLVALFNMSISSFSAFGSSFSFFTCFSNSPVKHTHINDCTYKS